MKTIHFNTGRRYTAHGQRITATLHDDGVVTFHDHDRMINGEFKLGQHCSFNGHEVMNWYDYGGYVETKRSRLDAVTCNAGDQR